MRATAFDGCMTDVSFDGKRIGLYNFRELTGSGCQGCLPVAGDMGDGDIRKIFSFDGFGYAKLPQVAKYNARRFIIELDFKTFWDDALLFFVHNTENGDYVSLELLNGRVVFKFSFGGESDVELMTMSRYNTNTWVISHVNFELSNVLKKYMHLYRRQGNVLNMFLFLYISICVQMMLLLFNGNSYRCQWQQSGSV